MGIVLNEREWAEGMMSSCTLGKKPFDTLRRVARYYIDSEYSKRDVRDLMDKFLIQCDPKVSLPKWSNTVDHAISYAMKYKAIKIDYIAVTDTEMGKIDSLDGKQQRRLAFTLLCLAKYWDVVNTSSDHWVNTKDSEIMNMANINTSIARQSAMYHQLRELGMIQFSKKVDNTNVRVLFAADGQTVMRISDFRNLGYQYLMYHGEPYFECCNCGVVTKLNTSNKAGRRQKYCNVCAVEVATRQNVNSVMRIRSNMA